MILETISVAPESARSTLLIWNFEGEISRGGYTGRHFSVAPESAHYLVLKDHIHLEF